MDDYRRTLTQLPRIRADLDNLRDFARRMERSLRQELQSMAADVTAENHDPAGVWHLPAALPWLYRGSALLTLFGFFEHNLNALCECLREEAGIRTRITDLPGRGLRRAKLYITRDIGAGFPANSESWNRLLKYAEVRNLIAHRDSLVKADDPDLLRFIADEPRLDIDAGGRVRLLEGALAAVLDRMQVFFDELEVALGETGRGD